MKSKNQPTGIAAQKDAMSGENNLRPNRSLEWLKLAGAFSGTAAMRAETRRIQKAIDEEFEKIEQGD